VVNLGGDHGVPLLEMLRALEKVSGLQARIQYLPPQAGDIPHTRADISKAKALLGFAPRTSFEEGLQAFWNWLQDQI
jgi:UDP-glucuronate 4-epimerase